VRPQGCARATGLQVPPPFEGERGGFQGLVPDDEFDNFDGDEEFRGGGGEGNVEREELNGKSQITLGSVVVVQLDDDTTAFGIV